MKKPTEEDKKLIRIKFTKFTQDHPWVITFFIKTANLLGKLVSYTLSIFKK